MRPTPTRSPQVSRPKTNVAGPSSIPPPGPPSAAAQAAQPLAKRPRPAGYVPGLQSKAGAARPAAGAPVPTAAAAARDAAADEYTDALVGMLMDRIGQASSSIAGVAAAGAAVGTGAGAGAGASTVGAAPVTKLGAAPVAKLGGAGAGAAAAAAAAAKAAKRREREGEGDEDVRRRVREQLTAALAVSARLLVWWVGLSPVADVVGWVGEGFFLPLC